jgi:hypothetical protein
MLTTHLNGCSAIDAAAACLNKYTGDINKAKVENEQDEEIESMLSSAEVDVQATKTHDGACVIHEPMSTSKRTKLDTCEVSLKLASTQVVVTNTLTEYARFVIGSGSRCPHH